MPVKPPASDLIDKPVYACRILDDQGVVDGLAAQAGASVTNA